MKRFIVVVEGQTEAEFINEVVTKKYLHGLGIYNPVTPLIIQTSKGHKGGFVNFEHLRNDVACQLKSKDPELRVSTFVDFFRCPSNFPGINDSLPDTSHLARIQHMETCFANEIGDRRFRPYIQMHEFEALLFASNRGFEKYMDDAVSKQTAAIVAQYPNPEDINTTPQGAPSKRLQSIYPRYEKVIDGNICAIEVGIQAMIDTCPRFAAWMQWLVDECK